MSEAVPIRTLLVANRGEIACRVIRTAREMGIRTVAVHSDPDAGALHVRAGDVAVALGGSTSGESYLDQAKILAAAERAGADAIHPGYGFLAENAAFAEACAAAGIVFVGPSPEAIRTMGLKDLAKARAREAGVPVLEDAEIAGDDRDEWLAAAEPVGYPLLVKATAGGGGRGMRLVTEAGELADAVEGARREAGGAFGNADVFLERYLQVPRHIEIQVFGDSHGNVVHLLERECSIQRRHQKVIEECPSPAVDPELRERMGETAVALARSLGYVGAGTVEYLLDDSGDFFFLEMNTRLQVEHPVTEEVTGLDLVRLQLLVAQGEPLPFEQADVVASGHAIEARLYAESPAGGFSPTFGTMWRYEHASVPRIRYEDGIDSGSEVTTFYDPLLAKVVAHAPGRVEAAGRLALALRGMRLHGPCTNRDFLAAVLDGADFLAGETRTDFVDAHPELVEPGSRTPLLFHLAAAVAVSAHRRRATAPVAGHAPPGWRLLPGSPGRRATWREGDGESLELEYRLAASRLTLALEGETHEVVLGELGADGARVRHDGIERRCEVAVGPDGSVWVNDSETQSVWRQQPRLPETDEAVVSGNPVASIPGTVVAVHVAVGDRVESGQTLVVLEAMKMEHGSVAAAAGVVEAIHVEVGQYVEAHAKLVTLSQDGSGE
ncbi:MAG: ATP-grasp domain-containing protein [Gaiellaceae bacterium MAG52_C11]|nr:ATP-grasp domain-containing protein [Candidatus Gaiellasilicea maunaloa]